MSAETDALASAVLEIIQSGKAVMPMIVSESVSYIQNNAIVEFIGTISASFLMFALSFFMYKKARSSDDDDTIWPCSTLAILFFAIGTIIFSVSIGKISAITNPAGYLITHLLYR